MWAMSLQEASLEPVELLTLGPEQALNSTGQLCSGDTVGWIFRKAVNHNEHLLVMGD